MKDQLSDIRKNISCLILPFSSENVSFLNVILMKHATLIIGHTAADCILLPNAISISQKVSGENNFENGIKTLNICVLLCKYSLLHRIFLREKGITEVVD